MKDIFREIVACLEKRERVVLATIVSSSGSSPLPSGAMMLVREGGEETVGSVGGGLLEALVIEEAKKYFAGTRQPGVGRFDLNDDVSNEGMICGGSVDVLLELTTHDDLPIHKSVADARNGGSDVVLVRILDNAGRSEKVVSTSKQEPLPASVLGAAGEASTKLAEVVRHSFGQDDVRRFAIARGEVIVQPVKGMPDLIVFGGGHVGKYLAQIASVAGFSSTVIDDREEFADTDRFPGVARVFSSEFDTSFEKITITPSTYIVIVTRGHSYDEQVLGRAVRTPAKYIGMIGSKRKVIACFENLRNKGVPLSDLKRVHAPIGLDIGAVSAEEIAVSIVAELIRVRRGFTGPSDSISLKLKDWFAKLS
ncbi:MAG TPA: XdhC family protein [Bacteroidota bacterium]|nr:XdhC family protein [Bacteroidota bacterium]